MPKSKSPRRPYRGSRSARDLRAAGPRPSSVQHSEHQGQHDASPSVSSTPGHGSIPPAVPRSPAPGPSPAGLSAAAGHSRGKRGILIAAGAAGVGAGGLVYDRKRRRAQVSKIYNPFTGETVEVGKAYPVAIPIPGSKPVTPLVARGRHVSSENDLSVSRHRTKRKGSPSALAQYHSAGDSGRSRMSGGGHSYGNATRKVGKSLDTQQGAASFGSRGTPMTDLARSGRVGRRLVVA